MGGALLIDFRSNRWGWKEVSWELALGARQPRMEDTSLRLIEDSSRSLTPLLNHVQSSRRSLGGLEFSVREGKPAGFDSRSIQTEPDGKAHGGLDPC